MPYFVPLVLTLFTVLVIGMMVVLRGEQAWYFLANILTIVALYIGAMALFGYVFTGSAHTLLFNSEAPWRWVWLVMWAHAWIVATRVPIWKRWYETSTTRRTRWTRRDDGSSLPPNA